MSSLTLQGATQAIVTGSGVTLYVTGNITIGSSWRSFTSPRGASLNIYCGAASGSTVQAKLDGASISTQPGLARTRCAFFGLPTCTYMGYNGSSTYVGTIYAPSAQLVH